jgi:hypothetical protein
MFDHRTLLLKMAIFDQKNGKKSENVNKLAENTLGRAFLQ